MPVVVPSYPDLLLPLDEAATEVEESRTLTNLYNARPAWLDHLHRRLDDDEISARLFRLNQERAATGR